MKNFFKVMFAVFLAFVITACDNDEIGGGKNQSQGGGVDETAAYGPVINKSVFATDVLIRGRSVSNNTTAIDFVDKQLSQVEYLTLVCDVRSNNWGFLHSLKTPDGQPADLTRDSEIAILNYPKGTKDIHLMDDPKVVFSSLDEDNGHDIVKGLKAIAKLDPDSYVSIVIDREGYNAAKDEYGPYAWSHLYKVKDMIKGLKQVDLTLCGKVDMRDSRPEIVTYLSEDTVVELIKSKQL